MVLESLACLQGKTICQGLGRCVSFPHQLLASNDIYGFMNSVWKRNGEHSFSRKHFLSLKHLHIEEGDIVIDENNNEKYLMVKNPTTSKIDHYKKAEFPTFRG